MLILRSYRDQEKLMDMIEALYRKDQMVGYALIVSFWSNEHGGRMLSVDELYVKETFRGRGIGSAFLDQLEEREDCVAIILEVTPTNKGARNLYMNRGYTPSQNRHLRKKRR